MTYCTARDVADRYRVSRRTVRRWVIAGMPVAIRRGTMVRYDPAAVEAWLRRNSEPGPRPAGRRDDAR